MRNKTVSILMAMLLCVSSLTGCGSKSSDKMDKDGNITLNFWSIYPEGDANYDWFQKIIAEYEEEHTNVKSIMWVFLSGIISPRLLRQ